MSWKNISITKKLYTVVGIMGILILGELFTLNFAMRKLSGVRAFVGGESLWSKAQKDAVISFGRYSRTRDEADFDDFLKSMQIPEGDHEARLELAKRDPDMEVIRHGFMQGQIPADDIPQMVELIRDFYWESHLARAIEIWSRGDELLGDLRSAGVHYHAAVLDNDKAVIQQITHRIRELDLLLTDVENRFSFTLGEGSRWVERTVFSVLFLLVLTVEGVGLTLTFRTSRGLSRGLKELESAATRIGQGDFGRKANVVSRDEIGKLAGAINHTGELLEKSYQELEERVRERTLELEKLAQENAKLYEEAKHALQMRDEFLSIASHELKTPVTALHLELQLLARVTREGGDGSGQKVVELSNRATLNSKRLAALLEDLLDLTRIHAGKLDLHREPGNLAGVIRDVASGFAVEAARQQCEIHVSGPDHVPAEFDSLRIGQIVSNLISNAIKYAPGAPIDIEVGAEGGMVSFAVRDRGPGVAPEDHERIFERLERGSQQGVGGLGLGLYISRELAQAHGGTIRLESKLGSGSLFVVELPQFAATSSALGRGRG